MSCHIIYINIQGLFPKSNNTKVKYLSELINECTNNIAIVLTETHLTPDIMDSEIRIPGYNLFRKDRCKRSHGGVAIYVLEDIISKELNSFSNGVCEYLSVELKLKK